MSQSRSTEETEAIEALAADIGDRVYLDIARWHLYLKDARLHTQVAQQAYDLVRKGPPVEAEALDILRQIAVEVGGGRRQIPLLDLIPLQGQVAFLDILEAFQRRL